MADKKPDVFSVAIEVVKELVPLLDNVTTLLKERGVDDASIRAFVEWLAASVVAGEIRTRQDRGDM